MKLNLAGLIGLLSLLGLNACTNIAGQKHVQVTASPSPGIGGSGLGTTSTSGITYTVTNATIAAGTGVVQIFTIYLSAANPSIAISNSCSGSQSTTNTKPCSCQFAWVEINQTGATQVSVQHTVVTDILSVQPTVVTCNAPAVYTSEIPDNTSIKISIAPSGANSGGFSVNPLNFVKSSSVATGSFQDVEGKSFDNIMRYSCYDVSARYTSVSSKVSVIQNSVTNVSATLVKASDFCAVGTPTADCPNQGSKQPTSQSYYYNLFIRNTERGNINTENTRYHCPLIKETLNSINTSGSQMDYYPMDTSFALALSAAADYPVGVEAFSKVGIANDPGSASSSCSGAAVAAGDTSSLVRSCLGFAAKPLADGTCPLISLPSGQKKNTFRLRRFIALYPPLYEADGKMLPETQASDTIYVLDRPLTAASASPDKPFTMRGPKPCPFAYFDVKAVTDTSGDVLNYPNGTPGFAATNNSKWNGTSVDGTQFPNIDIAGGSCAATLPLLSDDRSTMSLASVHSSNPALKKLFVRPVRAWTPHYEEDTDFQACAPQSAPFIKDPPLHFSKDVATGNVNWCAEAYPTQNPNVTQLDIKNAGTGNYPGKVMPFTSHVTKNSLSTACVSTLPSLTTAQAALYPTAASAGVSGTCTPAAAITVGTALHPANMLIDSLIPSTLGCGTGNSSGGNCYYCANQTCDRTVENNNYSFPYPLLARAPQVETAINSDSTYGCMVSFDNGGAKTGKQTPTQGCCGNAVKVWTGNAAVGGIATKFNKVAHLEPNSDPTVGSLCAQPTY